MLAARLIVAVAALAGSVSGTANRDAGEISLHIREDDEPLVVAPVIGSLVDGDVARIRVEGGIGGAGLVQQCVTTPEGFAHCSNGFPVQFDDEGLAYFQYQLHDSGACGPMATCAVVVSDGDGATAHAYTIFGAPAPPRPVVTRTPPSPYVPGDRVAVEVSSVAPGIAVSVAFCAATCDDPVVVTAGPDGRAVAELTIGDRCSTCGIRISAGVHEVSTLVEFRDPPRPSYRPGRLTLGLTAAAVLIAAAWWIIRRTDWRPPSEAATPDLDAATP